MRTNVTKYHLIAKKICSPICDIFVKRNCDE